MPKCLKKQEEYSTYPSRCGKSSGHKKECLPLDREDAFLGDEKGFMKKIPFEFYILRVFFLFYSVGISKYRTLLI